MNVLLITVLLGCLGSSAAGCQSDDDCSLLGSCVSSKCQCRKGWTGDACSAGDFAPLDVSLGYHNATESSWGGRPILDPTSGIWQLMVTEIKNHCPLILFQYNSMVVRAESTTADAGGPYSHKEVVQPPFHHNPTFVGPTPDGYYLLFFIGTDLPKREIDCRVRIPDVPIHPDPPLKSNGYTTMAWTKDIVHGPWHHRVVLMDNQDPLTPAQAASWHCQMNNPTAQVLKNGTVVLVFRANACDKKGGERLGVAVATDFRSEFQVHPDPIVSPTAQNITSNNEDPFVWVEAEGTAAESWHIVNHQQSHGNLCGSADAGHSCGAHFFARDPRGPWRMSPQAVYSADVTLADGTAASFQTRQRPQLVFNPDGSPQYLFTSGSFEGNNPDLNITTHTYAHGFRK